MLSLQQVVSMLAFFNSMIDVIQEELEWPIGHTFEINEVDLSLNSKTKGDNILDPHHWLPPA